MKAVFLVLILSFLTVHAQADQVLACKKPTPYVYGTFYWVQIERAPNGEMTFTHGAGDSERITDIFFSSEIHETTKGNFEHLGDDYQLHAKLDHAKFSFVLKDKKHSVKRSNYKCL
jgi:hypothetical protein